MNKVFPLVHGLLALLLAYLLLARKQNPRPYSRSAVGRNTGIVAPARLPARVSGEQHIRARALDLQPAFLLDKRLAVGDNRQRHWIHKVKVKIKITCKINLRYSMKINAVSIQLNLPASI
jgi:hypothetical protein